MADWRLYPVDRAANRVGAAQVSASSNATLAKNVVISRQVESWVSGTTASGTWVGFDFGQQHTIIALALGNCKNIAGEQIRVYYDGSSIGDTSGGVHDFFTYPSSGELDILFTFSADNKRYPMFDFSSAISSSLSIGTVSWLDSGAMIQIGSGEGAEYPIVQPLDPGFSEIPIVGGGSIRKTNGGPIRRWLINLATLAAEATETYDKIKASLVSTNGWINGVWLTTETYDRASDMRAYYCRPAATTPIQGAVTTAGAYADLSIELVEFQRGPV